MVGQLGNEARSAVSRREPIYDDCDFAVNGLLAAAAIFIAQF